MQSIETSPISYSRVGKKHKAEFKVFHDKREMTVSIIRKTPEELQSAILIYQMPWKKYILKAIK